MEFKIQKLEEKTTKEGSAYMVVSGIVDMQTTLDEFKDGETPKPKSLHLGRAELAQN